ncbi:MAG TPA: pseudouridine synthase [Candidatus Acidoferrales bacterium]|nr:pseudouridine synthase [Candidatus Acidoferrales bacterium]
MNRFLARCGVASRRGADLLIKASRVRVDGSIASLGLDVDPDRSIIMVDGRRVRPTASSLTLVFNKPASVITTMHDERGRKSVASFLPRGQRLFPVGRLDAETTGVLLCTNDGDLANFLLAPKNEIERTYRVTVRGGIGAAMIRELGASQVSARRDGTTTFTITLREGRNRQVRRMCARQGLRVIALCRTRFGPVSLGDLKVGLTRALTSHEMSELERLRHER